MKKLLAVLLVSALLLPCMAAAEDIVPILPVCEKIGSAQLADVQISDDHSEVYLAYAPASSSDMELYLTVCSLVGTYCKPTDASGMNYRLFVPGSAYGGTVRYDSEKKEMIVYSPAGPHFVSDEELDDLLSFANRDVKLPANASGSVFPQFYACVNRSPYNQGTVEGSTSIFSGKKCWTEYYDGMTNDSILLYTKLMYLFGFDMRADSILGSMEEGVTTCVLHYSNGDAEVIVIYTPAQGAASVSYKPGVSMTLLSAGELNEALR